MPTGTGGSVTSCLCPTVAFPALGEPLPLGFSPSPGKDNPLSGTQQGAQPQSSQGQGQGQCASDQAAWGEGRKRLPGTACPEASHGCSAQHSAPPGRVSNQRGKLFCVLRPPDPQGAAARGCKQRAIFSCSAQRVSAAPFPYHPRSLSRCRLHTFKTSGRHSPRSQPLLVLRVSGLQVAHSLVSWSQDPCLNTDAFSLILTHALSLLSPLKPHTHAHTSTHPQQEALHRGAVSQPRGPRGTGGLPGSP